MKLIFSLSLFLFSVTTLLAQTLYTRNDTIPITQDSITLKAGTFRGNIQWQKSLDNTNWIDLEGKTKDSLRVKADIEAMYRAVITDGTCLPVYSDSVTVKPKMVNGSISLLNGTDISNIVISSIVDETTIDSTNLFSMKVHTIIFAFDTLIGKPVYIGYPGDNEIDKYKLDAKETALYYCLLTIPNSRRPYYRPFIKSIKEAFYQLPEVKALENKIEEVVSLKGYLDTDDFFTELQTAINKILIEFEADDGSFNQAENTTYTKSAHSNFVGPIWNTDYHNCYFRVSNEVPNGWSDLYNAQSGIYTLKRNFYNRSQGVIGVSIGKWNKTTNRGEKTDGYVGFLEPYFPPDMLSVNGNWENLKQLGKAMYDLAENGIEGFMQSDFDAEHNDFDFELKENEKDVFLFINGFYDNSLIDINVIYLMIDNLTGILKAFNIENTDDFVVLFLKDIINNPTVNFYNYRTWLEEGKCDLIIEDFKPRLIDFANKTLHGVNSGQIFIDYLSKQLFKELSVATGVYYKVRTASKIILNMQATTSKNFYAEIPVSFDSYGFPPPPSDPAPFVITKNNVNKIDFSWNMPQDNPSYKYNLYLSSSSDKVQNTDNECLIASSITGLKYSLSTFFGTNTVYFWRIEVVSSVSGKKTLGPVWYFKIGDQSGLYQPSFSISPEEGNTSTNFSFDATNVLNYYNINVGTEIRWDFNGDGIWDTPWMNEKSTSHLYSEAGNYTVKLQIKPQLGYDLILIRDVLVRNLLLPTITTNSITAITQTTATSGGTVTSDGGATITVRGVCWSTTTNPTINNSKTTDGTGTGSFTSNLIGLTASTTYYLRAYATNSQGTAYGNEVTFTTDQVITQPTVTTNSITAITQTTATSGGNVTSDGGATITARGVCWSTSQNTTTANSKTTNGSGTGSFTSNLIGLTANTTYYVRAYATNSQGTAYGNQESFTTNSNDIIFNPNLNYGTITDNEGNVYKTIQIGTQTWMAENLKTTKYNDGTSIPNVTDDTAWANLITPGYCWYKNDAANKNIYGALYNWYTVNTGKLAPIGWHVPTDAEWTTLTTFLGSENAGGKLKETGITHWISPNIGATNESGFSALPVGYRGDGGTYDYVGYDGSWWSSTEIGTDGARYRFLSYGSGGIGVSRSGYDNGESCGFSVRCVKGDITANIVIPTLNTSDVSDITQTSATSGGNITSDGGATVTARGVCWSTSQNPTTANSKTTDGTGTGSFTSNLTGLTANTTYYVRAYATNSQGTAYGTQVTFTTSAAGNPTGTFTDSRDGRTYNTIIINGQEWMAENLAYLPAVSPSSAISITEPYYYVYGYEGTSMAAAKGNANYTTYGVLYNWPAAKAACPPGWHLPSDNEWTALTTYLGGEEVAGGKMKETGTAHWLSPNTGATNESGFSALPGGYCYIGGYFYHITYYGFWWSSTEGNSNDAWFRYLYSSTSSVSRNYYSKFFGFSMRCVRD